MNYKYENSIICFEDENMFKSFKEYADYNTTLKDARNVLKIKHNDNYVDCSLNVGDAYKKGWQDCLKFLGKL